MLVERRGLTEVMFLAMIQENRLVMKPTTEEESTPVDPLGRRSLPRKVSNLRRGLGQKAKQEPNVAVNAVVVPAMG